MMGIKAPMFQSGYPSSFAQYESQRIWLEGQQALARANTLLAREQSTSFVSPQEQMYMHAMMEENARLTRENMSLRVHRSGSMHERSEKESSRQSKRQSFIQSLKEPAAEETQKPKKVSSKRVSFSTELDMSLQSDDTSFRSDASCGTDSSLGSWTSDAAFLALPGLEAPPFEAFPEIKKPPSTGPSSSLMMRHLPADYTRSTLLELLDAEGFAGKYDFVYLPIDLNKRSNVGYAFINLLDGDTAEQFRQHFAGFNRWSVTSDKVCKVARSSLRGLDAHIEYFRNSSVMAESVPEDLKPVLLEGSERVKFPEPTREIKKPQQFERR
jgi:hypothetical protein